MQFVRQCDTRQLLQTLEQFSGLSLTVAVLRKQQGRSAQAAAARRAGELLSAEQTGRTHSADAGLRGCGGHAGRAADGGVRSDPRSAG